MPADDHGLVGKTSAVERDRRAESAVTVAQDVASGRCDIQFAISIDIADRNALEFAEAGRATCGKRGFRAKNAIAQVSRTITTSESRS